MTDAEWEAYGQHRLRAVTAEHSRLNNLRARRLPAAFWPLLVFSPLYVSLAALVVAWCWRLMP